MKGKIVNVTTKEQLDVVIREGKIARLSLCSTDNLGKKCGEFIEKQLNAEVRGTLASKKENLADKCVICDKNAKAVVYVGKSY